MLLLALAAQAVEAAPVVADETPEQVVIGRRLSTWRGSFKVRDGRVACTTRRSSGDKAIDAIGCAAMTECFAPLIPQVDALAAGTSRAERARRFNELAQAQLPCLDQARRAGIERLARERQAL